MHIRIQTLVQGNVETVFAQCNKDLFVALQPKFPRMLLERYDGESLGDQIHIRFLFPFNTKWVSVISDVHIQDSIAWFEDAGILLPFGLKSWKHKHIAQYHQINSTYIIDDIYFKCYFTIFNPIAFLCIFVGMWVRKPIYKRYFLQK